MIKGTELGRWLDRDLEEVTRLLSFIDPDAGQALGDGILGAKRIFVLGAGRSGLMLEAFAMRLMHIGLTAHVVGAATTPPIGRGDLLIVSSASGSTATVLSAARAARRARARVAALTAGGSTSVSKLADLSVRFRGAKTKALEATSSAMPLGTVFEQASLVFLDALVAHLAARRGVTEEDMRSRHNNLE